MKLIHIYSYFEEIGSDKETFNIELNYAAAIPIAKKKEFRDIGELIDSFQAFPMFEETIEEHVEEEDGIPVITNPTSELLVVNKERRLPLGFEPPDLIVPNVPFSFSGEDEKKYLREVAAKALEEMFSTAAEDDIHLFAVSGYRSYERQKMLYEYYVGT
ncbi:MAG TPA: D-alanyl-D-alanine carboxypeptidase family protein, partial [Brumimicrobium sp.]|nr:D-alanyl-D-alanine carboxypeptidase family protein [Brumimicrobium sp.]